MTSGHVSSKLPWPTLGLLSGSAGATERSSQSSEVESKGDGRWISIAGEDRDSRSRIEGQISKGDREWDWQMTLQIGCGIMQAEQVLGDTW